MQLQSSFRFPILRIVLAILFVMAAMEVSEAVAQTPTVGQPSVLATLSRPTVQVAEPFTVTITVTAPPNSEVVFAPLPETLDGLLVVKHEDRPNIPAADSTAGSPAVRVWTRRIRLESLLGGSQTFPAQEIQVRVDDQWKSLRTDPVEIQVVSAVEEQSDPKQYRDIQSVVDVVARHPTSYRWVWWAIAGIGFGAIAFAAVAGTIRRRAWLSPREWAVAELDRLRSEIHGEDYDGEYVANELPRILKDYLEMQFEVSAPAQTTSELLLWIDDRLANPKLLSRFEELFAFADEVKFAGLPFDDAELIGTIERTERLVEETAEMTIATTQREASAR